MKNKKIIMYFIIIILLLFILGIGYLVYINITGEKEEEIKEYIPQEEISNENLRSTVVSLYFANKDTKALEEERRKIDSKDLLDNPYKTLIELLISGPENENLEGIFPKETEIKDIKIENGIIKINFLNNTNLNENKELIYQSIEKTLKNLNEVEKIEIINN